MELTLNNNIQTSLAKFSISSFSSIEASENRVKNVLTGYYNPIRSMAKEDVKNFLSVQISAAAKAYSGMKEGDRTMPEIIQECVRFTYDQFNFIGVNEVMDAFKLAAANRFDNVDIKAYGGVFTVSMLGDVLHAYTKYRNKIVAKYLELKDKEQKEIKAEQMKDERNRAAIETICKEIEQAIIQVQIGENLIWESWQDVPVHYAEVAVREGIIEVSPEFKREIWELSKKLALQEIKSIAADSSNILEAKQAIMKLKVRLESEVIKDPAVRIYSKLLVFEYVNMHKI